MAVIMLLIWTTTSQSISGKKRVEERDAVYHLARVAMDKITQDLTMAFLLEETAHGGVRQGAPQVKTVFFGEADRIHFVSLSHLRLFQTAKESESAEIGYRLESDPETRGFAQLLRRESKTMDGQPEEGGVWIPLATQVKELVLEYYDATQFDWKSSWNSESGEKGKLPRAVRVRLSFADPKDPDEKLVFTTVALVGMYKNAVGF